MALPPPQQKFLPFSLSMVTIGAFHAASSNVARLLRFGISHRIVVVAPTRASASGATNFFSHDLPGRPSESANARNSKSAGKLLDREAQVIHFLAAALGFSAITT